LGEEKDFVISEVAKLLSQLGCPDKNHPGELSAIGEEYTWDKEI